MPNQYLGEIVIMGCDYPPKGWAYCDGSTMPVSQNAALFALIGSQFGGDGHTTFALPDLRGRIPVGATGASSILQGQKFGAEGVALTTQQIPHHTHGSVVTEGALQLEATDELGDIQAPTEDCKLASGEGSAAGHDFYIYNNSSGSPSTLGGVSVSASISVENTGTGGRHANLQPYQAMNYVIALAGTYPSRS